uniref:EIF-4F 25 kDa subunit n=1 Tax=Trichuris muris TaxID=70415 RepID=A0A5S6QYN7_TRIMR
MHASDQESTDEKSDAIASTSQALDISSSSVDKSDQMLLENGISWLSMTKLLLSKEDIHERSATLPPTSRTVDKPKNRLQERWALWLWESNNPADSGHPEEGTLSKLGTFETACDFWTVFNGAKRVSMMSWQSECYLFMESFDPTAPRSVQPDEGHWIACFDPSQHEAMDRYWMMTIIAITEGKLKGYGETLLGAGMAVREKGDMITVWTKRNNVMDKPRQGLGDMLRMVLGAKRYFRYVSHRNI